MTKNCPKCGYETYDEATICHNCGKRLIEVPKTVIESNNQKINQYQNLEIAKSKVPIKIRCYKKMKFIRSERNIPFITNVYQVPYGEMNISPEIESQYYCPHCSSTLNVKIFPPGNLKLILKTHIIWLFLSIICFFTGVALGGTHNQGLYFLGSLLILGWIIFLVIFLLIIYERMTNYAGTINKNGNNDSDHGFSDMIRIGFFSFFQK